MGAGLVLARDKYLCEGAVPGQPAVPAQSTHVICMCLAIQEARPVQVSSFDLEREARCSAMATLRPANH